MAYNSTLPMIGVYGPLPNHLTDLDSHSRGQKEMVQITSALKSAGTKEAVKKGTGSFERGLAFGKSKKI